MSRTKKPPQNPLTEEHKNLFESFMGKWQVLLNLMDWRIVREKKPTKYMAEVSLQETEHRLVRYRIGSDFGATPVTEESLESTACHESMHILLHRLIEAAMREGEYNDIVMGEEHGVIAVLEPLLMQLAKYKDLEVHALQKMNERR